MLCFRGFRPCWSRLASVHFTEKARNLSDGYVYSMIRYGKGGMPRYGDKVYRREDRWAIVNYVRQLQHAAGTDTLARGRTGAQP